MKRKVNIIRILILLSPILVILGAFVYFYLHPLFLRSDHRDVELAFEKVDPKEEILFSFLADKEDVTVEGTVDTSKTGTYDVVLTCRSQTETITYTVKDTLPPELTVKSIETDTFQDVNPKQFVKECKDASNVTFSFKEDPSKQSGKQTIVIQAVDSCSNTTEKEAVLTRIEDKTAPRITGMQNIKIRPGEIVDLQAGIETDDDMDASPEITVDDSAVDYNTPGEYEVVYTAVDRSGNEARESVLLTIEAEGDTHHKVVYLTFDGGPSDVTLAILDVLNTYNVKATFFVSGNGQDYNDSIVQAYNAGHTIGLYSYTQDYEYIYASVENYSEDLNRLRDMVENLIGIRPNIIRFPGGSTNTISDNYAYGIMNELTQMVTDEGYYYFDWYVDSQDAVDIGVDPSIIVENAVSGTEDSIVILMHDTFGKETTVEALPAVIEYYRDQGYTFAALNEYSPQYHHQG